MNVNVDSSPARIVARNRPYSLYDLGRPEFIADPWPLYRWLLAHDGPYWDPGVRSWLSLSSSNSTPPTTVVPPSGTITCVVMLCELIAGAPPPTTVAAEAFSATTVRMTVP